MLMPPACRKGPTRIDFGQNFYSQPEQNPRFRFSLVVCFLFDELFLFQRMEYFNEAEFKTKVDEALGKIRPILETTRSPTVASPDVAHGYARRARSEFGFLRMWSIHPRQIQPIVEAMRPDFAEVTEASGILLAAQNADWGPISWEGKLHDRASYRYYWELLRRAHATGVKLPAEARHRFFHPAAH